MLQLPLFTAEALLRNYGRDFSALLFALSKIKQFSFQNGQKNLFYNHGLKIPSDVVKSPV